MIFANSNLKEITGYLPVANQQKRPFVIYYQIVNCENISFGSAAADIQCARQQAVATDYKSVLGLEWNYSRATLRTPPFGQLSLRVNGGE